MEKKLKQKVKIALDTNMLFAVSQFKVDVVTQIREMFVNAEITIPTQVKKELEFLAEREKKEVAIALKVIEREKIREVKNAKGNADEALEELAEKGFIVATNDKELKKRILNKNGRVLILRQKKIIQIA